MDRITFCKLNLALIVDRVASNIKDASESPFAYRHGNWTAGVVHFHSAFQTLGRRHRDRADPVFAEMLLNFERKLGRIAINFILDLKCVVDSRKLNSIAEFHVYYRSDYLNNVSCIHKSR